MATLKGKYLSGIVGNVVYKPWRAIQVVQSKPAPQSIKQTKATKKAAGHFGKSSALARDIREMFGFLIHEFYDGPMIERLVSETRKVVTDSYQAQSNTYHFSENSFDRLSRFDYNLKSPVRNSLNVLPVFSLTADELTVTLPELENHKDLKFPKGASGCVIHIHVQSYNLEHGIKINNFQLPQIAVTIDQAIIEKQEFKFTLPAECLSLTTIGLHYYKSVYSNTTLINSKEFSPTAICSAIVTSGAFKKEMKHRGANPKVAFGKADYTGRDLPKSMIQETKQETNSDPFARLRQQYLEQENEE